MKRPAEYDASACTSLLQLVYNVVSRLSEAARVSGISIVSILRQPITAKQIGFNVSCRPTKRVTRALSKDCPDAHAIHLHMSCIKSGHFEFYDTREISVLDNEKGRGFKQHLFLSPHLCPFRPITIRLVQVVNYLNTKRRNASICQFMILSHSCHC